MYQQHQQMNLMPQNDDPVLQQLLSQFSSMQSKIEELSNRDSSSKKTGSKKSGTINPKTGQPWKRYCWSCGCCTHWSKYCPTKKPGHKDDATFRNRMDGSNANCL